MNVLPRAGVAAAALVLLAVAAVRGPVSLAAPARPAILAVRANLVEDTVTITGTGFGQEAPPVSLGGVPLVVTSSSETELVAELPEGSAGANHRLVVGAHNRVDSADIWIPGEGIVTRGGIRIESTESDVRIVAGLSKVTVTPAGGIRIESNGPVALDSQGALTLRGNSVRIDSATSLKLNAGTSLEGAANGVADIRSSGAMTIRGSVINLN